MKSIVRLIAEALKPVGKTLAFFQRLILFTLVYLLAGPIALLRRLLREKRGRADGTFWLSRDTSRTTDFLRQY